MNSWIISPPLLFFSRGGIVWSVWGGCFTVLYSQSQHQGCPQFTLAGGLLSANLKLLQTCCEEGSSNITDLARETAGRTTWHGLFVRCRIIRVCRQRYQAPGAGSIKEPHKKKRNGVICSEVDGVRVYHTEWSKSEREKQIQYANTYIWNLREKKKVMKNLVARRE